jgi:hypothetical protein
MGLLSPDFQTKNRARTSAIRDTLATIADSLIVSLPPAKRIPAAHRRGVIARYGCVLEGNFVYWMTGAYLAAESDEARSIIEHNLFEEVRDCHPGMLRKFVLKARAAPTDTDALAVYQDLTNVRTFISGLSAAPIIAMMAFFEDFIQKFMPYLAELAKRQGSEEQEYTQVHSASDALHSQELFRALEAEMALAPASHKPAGTLYEGVYLLRALIHTIVGHQPFATI